MIEELTESVRRPGLLGLPGRSIERQCARDLGAYFKRLAGKVELLHLERHVEQPDLLARHAADQALRNVLRIESATLFQVLALNYQHAMLLGDKLTQVREADEPINPFPAAGVDTLGLSGQAAADYAAEHAAALVTGINDQTVTLLQDAISTGIEDQLGVSGTGRLIRSVMDDMSVSRAETIASTEMNDAMSEATLQKLDRLGIGYVRWILSDDACPICEENDDEVVAVGDLFSSGDVRPPVHPNCRCAIVGARNED